MAHKFEDLKVWQLSLDYLDLLYRIAKGLPIEERYNLSDQLRRAGTSVSLNIAEGSTGSQMQNRIGFLAYL